jgi:hypothetical protein
MEILTFRKGRILYRSPQSERKSHIFGHYFSVDDLACAYAESYNSKIYKFKTKNTLRLIDFSELKTFEYMYNNLKGDDLELFMFTTGYGLTYLTNEDKNDVCCYYKNKPKFQPKLCIIGQHKKDDVDYINLKFMKMICKLGYDGIRMPSKYVFQACRERLMFGDFLIKYFKTHPEHQYDEDYFLCKSEDHLEIISSDFIEDAQLCKNFH